MAVESAVSEEVTVAAGVAPSIEATLGAAMTMVTRADIEQRGVRESDAGRGERARSQSGVGRAGRGSGGARNGARPDADADRRQPRHF